MVFVIGASGFIGQYVVEKLLKRQYQIVVLVRDAKRYHLVGEEHVMEGTLNNCTQWCQELKGYPIVSCIHLAWEGIPDFSYEMCKRNLRYGMNVLEVCKEAGINHIVIAGSCGEYENPLGGIEESWEISYKNHFKAAKNSLRMICDAFCREYDIQYNWLRLFYVYGLGQRSGSLIPYIIDEFSQRRQPMLNGVYNENDFIYVTDVADAILKVLENRPDAKVMNIASGKAIGVSNIVELVAEKLGCRFDWEQYMKPKEIVSFYGDTTLANKELNWKAEVSLKKGIDIIIEKSVTVQPSMSFS